VGKREIEKAREKRRERETKCVYLQGAHMHLLGLFCVDVDFSSVSRAPLTVNRALSSLCVAACCSILQCVYNNT